MNYSGKNKSIPSPPVEFKKSEDRFRLLLENSKDIIYRMSLPDGKYEYISPASTNIFGYTPDELYATPRVISQIIHPSWKKYFELQWENLLKGIIPHSYEYQVIHKSGEIKWIYQENTLICDKKNKPTAIEGIIMDITDRKKAEEDLRENVEKYHTLFDSANDCLFIVDDKKFLECNYMTLEMFGCKDYNDIIGHHPWEFSPPFQPDHQLSEEKAKRLLDAAIKGEPQRFYWVHSRKDGTCFDAEVSLNRIYLQDRYLAQAIVRDITSRKQAEEEANRLRHLLDNIVNSMPSVIIGVDSTGRINQWNREAERFTSIKSEDASGKKLADIFPKPIDILHKVKKAIEESKPQKDVKVPYTSGNITRYIDITIYPLHSDGTEGAVIRIDDITECLRIEEIMIQSEKMLSIGGLAAGMAHEINNPLAAILQNIQVIRNRLSNQIEKNRTAALTCGTTIESIEHYSIQRGIFSMIDAVIEAGHRAASIVENMLNFSRKSNDRLAFNDIPSLMDKTIALVSSDYSLKKKYDFRQIDIQRHYETDITPVLCVSDQIQQVFLNILKNGAQEIIEHHTPQPAFIIRIEKELGKIRVEIEDNGPGMDENVRKRVFEPFFTTKEVGKGTGLGLSVSYYIITENHKGTFEVESIKGKGTKFIIRLPIKGGH